MFIYKKCDCEKKTTSKNTIKTSYSNLPNLLKLVSVPARLELLFLLTEKPHCVCDIASHTKLSQSLVSHHLSDLTQAGIIKSYKKGKFVEHELTDNGIKLVKTLKDLVIK